MKIDVLGEKYKVIVTNQKDEPRFARVSGFCDNTTKECVIDDFSTSFEPLTKGDLTDQMKKNIRHEIVHAFLYESGLAENSDWALNEEIVDWIAMQGLKLYKAWQEAGAV